MKPLMTTIFTIALSAPAFARDTEVFQPGWIDLDVQSAGYGCGQVYLASPTHLVIYGSDLSVEADYRRSDRARCSYILDIEAEAGWSYSVAGIYTKVNGEAWGGAASFLFSHYFQGRRNTYSVSRTLNDSGETTIAGSTYGDGSPCGLDRALIAKTQLNARGRDRYSSAFAELVSPVHVFLDWQRCANY